MGIETEESSATTILDADVMTCGDKQWFDLEAGLESRPQDQSMIAATTVAELWHGTERATKGHKADRERYIRSIIDSLPILPYTESTGLEQARIWAEFESSGRMIGNHDMIVATTAIEHRCRVATFNNRHFSQERGLKVLEPVVSPHQP